MRDPDDGSTEGATERLQAGPSRPPLFPPLPVRWRLRAAAAGVFALGVAAGVGTKLWWQEDPETPPRFRGDDHSVELVLFEAVAPDDTGPLLVRGALLLSGSITSTVSSIELLGKSVDIRTPRLPVTVSPSDRFQSFTMRITVSDCEVAGRWGPADRPFVIEWQDGLDREHTDRAGDFDRSIANELLRYIDVVCGS